MISCFRARSPLTVMNDKVESLIEMNVNSTVRMTSLVMPGMVARKRGAIVNFASAAAINPTPLLAVYSGAKGFIVVSWMLMLNVDAGVVIGYKRS